MKHLNFCLGLSAILVFAACGGDSKNNSGVAEAPVSLEQAEAAQHNLNAEGFCDIKLSTSYEATTYKEYLATADCSKSESMVEDYDRDAARLSQFRKVLGTAQKSQLTLSGQNEIKALLDAVSREQSNIADRKASLINDQNERGKLLSYASEISKWFKGQYSVDLGEGWLMPYSYRVNYNRYESDYRRVDEADAERKFRNNRDYKTRLERFYNLFQDQEFAEAIKVSAIKVIRFEHECGQFIQPRELLDAEGTFKICDNFSDANVINFIRAQISAKNFQDAIALNNELLKNKKIGVACASGFKMDLRSLSPYMDTCISEVNRLVEQKDELKSHQTPVYLVGHTSRFCLNYETHIENLPVSIIEVDMSKSAKAEDIVKCVNESKDLK